MLSLWRFVFLPTALFVLLSWPGAGPARPSAAKAPRTYMAYFYQPDEDAWPLGAYLVPVVFPLPEAAYPADALRLAFQALCEKPPAGLISAVKRGCKVGSARVEGDMTLLVDFAAGEVFQPSGTTGDMMTAEQIAMTAVQFNATRVNVAFQGGVPTDLGSHGIGNGFAATGRSPRFLVTPPVERGRRPETDSLRPDSSAVRNATGALTRPLLGVINRRLSELGRTDNLVKQVEGIIPSGDGTLWVKVPHFPGFYRLWWNGSEWKVDGL